MLLLYHDYFKNSEEFYYLFSILNSFENPLEYCFLRTTFFLSRRILSFYRNLQDDFKELKVNIVRFLKENNRVINL
ncbi:hypothetical protein D3859_08245 [Streptococcus mutans]|nr:hypothetical protein [Streptococcus mutans]